MTPPKKILLLIATLDAAGAEKQITELARRLDRNRFDVLLCCLTRGGPLEEKLKKYGVRYLIIGKKFKLDFSAVLRLAMLIRREKADILHTWMFTSNFFGRLAGVTAGVPRIIISERACDIWKTPFHFLLDRVLLRFTEKVVCVSEGVKKFCMEKYGLPEKKAAVIRNGIEITASASPPTCLRRELNLPEGAVLILTAGRLAPQKGMKYLVRAMPDVLAKFSGARLLAAGSGPELEGLRQEAAVLGIAGSIEFLGFRDDLRALMRASDVFVLPSIFEGLPNVLLEAMLEERPVVATDIPGTDEVVVHGETGLIVPPKNPDVLSEAVIALLSDRDRAETMGRAGRERVKKFFSIDDAVQKYENLYESLP